MSGLGPAQRIVLGVVMVSLAGIGFVLGRNLLHPKREVAQPIAFNHRIHAEILECETCHEKAMTGAHSGLPGLSTCLQCHEDPVTEAPEELKIAELAGAGAEQVFSKLFHLPDNVFYTHRRHTGIAGLECATCHGTIAETTAPPAAPLIRITMDFCIDCHHESGASEECTDCHR
jgi:hypothetical protein